MLINIFSVEII